MEWNGLKKDGKTQTKDKCMDNKPLRRSSLIDWLMGRDVVKKNSIVNEKNKKI